MPVALAQIRDLLLHNDGNGKFSVVTKAAGLDEKSISLGCAIGDFDNDGNIDLFVAGLYSNHLYRNNGKGKFEELTTTGILSNEWSVAAGWFDFDNDGKLDLLVTNYGRIDLANGNAAYAFASLSGQPVDLLVGIDGAIDVQRFNLVAGRIGTADFFDDDTAVVGLHLRLHTLHHLRGAHVDLAGLGGDGDGGHGRMVSDRKSDGRSGGRAGGAAGWGVPPDGVALTRL